MDDTFSQTKKDMELSPKRKNNFLKIILALAPIFIILFAYFVVFSTPDEFPVGSIQNVKEGASLKSVSRELKNNNIISSQVVFETFVILYGGEKHIIPGDYLFKYKTPVYEVAHRIARGEKHLAPVKVTIPEGFTNEDIADTFTGKLKNFNREKFLNLTEGHQGYLWPDTYFFLTTDTEQIVFDKMSSTFDKKISNVKNDIVKSGKSEKDIIIMASIIEGEANGDGDRELISGILWKRLSIGMALQADAAPITYKERGLPKEPISNPGLDAIKASIYPKSSPYLFYLHDKEGGIHYARNFTEHKKNIVLYLR